jgi:SAM-dependent methyltransferase
MDTLKEHFISAIVEEAIRRAGEGKTVRVLDLGCGTANYVPELTKEFPDVNYVGLEPIEASYKAALKNLEGINNAKVYYQLGYDAVADEKESSFDLVISLSVLEHIKQLKRFLALSVKYAKRDGLIVHRYDLGHALHTHSIKEWIHVRLGNNVPWLLPERQFVRYLAPSEVESLYKDLGVAPKRTTYHQMPNHKAFEKYFKKSHTTAIDELFHWEMKHQESIAKIPQKDRERLFPAIAVWGIKQ